MQKFYYAVAAIALVAMTSCGSKKEAPVEAESVPIEDIAPSPTEAVDAAFEALETADDEALEENLETITEQIDELAASGDEEAALSYFEKLQQWYEVNRERVQNSETVAKLVEKSKELAEKYDFEELKQKAAEKYQDLKDQYGDDAEALKDRAKEKYEDFKEQHGDEIKEKAGEAKEKAREQLKGLLK